MAFTWKQYVKIVDTQKRATKTLPTAMVKIQGHGIKGNIMGISTVRSQASHVGTPLNFPEIAFVSVLGLGICVGE